MPWCPKCKAEFREGIEICSDCKTELVDELEEEKIDYDEEVFLISVSGEIEANGIEALLKTYDIPVLRKHRDAGGYLNIYMGMSNTGIDLFVPSRVLDEAKEIIENKQEEILVADESINSFDEKYQRKRRMRTWAILLFLASGILFMAVMNLYELVKLIKTWMGF
ncbi:DUF2007 domain-containing protein [Wukongibacter baidiensis]|uniref:hypothetical protein n=1 Tax=Wukongibacter baidiensis TaxID=1723361 RepID=UPI003D7FEAF7